jgi:hypothetical protein
MIDHQIVVAKSISQGPDKNRFEFCSATFTDQIRAFKSMDLKAFYFMEISEDIAVD